VKPRQGARQGAVLVKKWYGAVLVNKWCGVVLVK